MQFMLLLGIVFRVDDSKSDAIGSEPRDADDSKSGPAAGAKGGC